MGTSGLIESKTYYLDGVFPYSDYITLRNAFEKLYPLSSLAGLCFTTIKAMPTATTFYSTGIKVMLVRFDPTAPAVDELKFLNVDDPGLGALFASKDSAITDSGASLVSTLNIAAKKSVSPLNYIDWWNDTLYYHKTNEFEYCFIDRDTFEYLADKDNLEFYTKDTTGGATVYRDKYSNIVNPATRGIHFSRAFMTMEKSTRIYGDYRSLKFRPHPEPALVGYDSRPSIAYYMGPTCPPIWSNGGDGTSTIDAAPPPMEMMAARQSINPPKDPCTCNAMDMVKLHQALKDAGEIGEDMGPAYRQNFTPITMATLLSVFFIIAAVALRLPFKTKEGGFLDVLGPLVNTLAYIGTGFISWLLIQLYRKIVVK
jgi:hypothetical protein